MILVRIILLPFRLVLGVIGLTLRVGYWVGSLPFRTTARAGRLVGIRGAFFFVLGVGVGLLVAPGPGREVRERLRRLVEGARPLTDDELAEKVQFELGHAPRTWHLPQPGVAVIEGRVELTGQVPHETGRQELERVASAVAGVTGIDNRLQVEESGDGSGTAD